MKTRKLELFLKKSLKYKTPEVWDDIINADIGKVAAFKNKKRLRLNYIAAALAAFVLVISLSLIIPNINNAEAYIIKNNHLTGVVFSDSHYHKDAVKSEIPQFDYDIKVVKNTVILDGKLVYNNDVYDVVLEGDVFSINHHTWGEYFVSRMKVNDKRFKVISFSIERDSKDFALTMENKPYAGEDIVRLVLQYPEKDEIICLESPIYSEAVDKIEKMAPKVTEESNPVLHRNLKKIRDWYTGYVHKKTD